MNKYEVGYEDNMIGIYHAESEALAIKQCLEDIKYASEEIRSEIYKSRKFNPFFAVKVNY